MFALVLVVLVFGWTGGKVLVGGAYTDAKVKVAEQKEQRAAKEAGQAGREGRGMTAVRRPPHTERPSPGSPNDRGSSRFACCSPGR